MVTEEKLVENIQAEQLLSVCLMLTVQQSAGTEEPTAA